MSIYIGRHVGGMLKNDAVIQSLVGGRVFPVKYAKSVNDKIYYPYIVYSRESTTPEKSKEDESVGDSSTVELVVVSKDYDVLLDIVGRISTLLRGGPSAGYESFEVCDCWHTIGADRYDYDEDAFFVTININYITNDMI